MAGKPRALWRRRPGQPCRRRLCHALLRALGSRHVFNALSQEKTGDFWVNGHMFGSQTCHTAEDVHHCDLLFVIGANPWIAHGFPNARDHLNDIRKDPDRKMIVIDPRRTETAELADLHLAVRPGADAFLLGAILARLVRRDAVDHDFIEQHTAGFAEVREALLRFPSRIGPRPPTFRSIRSSNAST